MAQDPSLPNVSDRVLYMKHPPITDKKDNKTKSYTLLTKFLDVVPAIKVLSNNLANMCVLVYRNNLQIFSNTAVNTRGLFGFYNDNLDLISTDSVVNVITSAINKEILDASPLILQGIEILFDTFTIQVAGETDLYKISIIYYKNNKNELTVKTSNITSNSIKNHNMVTIKNNLYNKNNIFGSRIGNDIMNNPYNVGAGPVDSSELKNYIYIANNNQMYRSIDLTGYEPLYTHTHEIVDIACTSSGQKVCAIDINGKLIKSIDYGNSFVVENNPTTLHKYLENNYGYRRLFYIDDFLYIFLNGSTLFTDYKLIERAPGSTVYIDAHNNIYTN